VDQPIDEPRLRRRPSHLVEDLDDRASLGWVYEPGLQNLTKGRDGLRLGYVVVKVQREIGPR
jgi:hypothetical protein